MSHSTLARLRGLPAAFLACAVFATVPAPARSAPALWLVTSSTAKIYVFGTFHALRRGVKWMTPKLESAMDESDDLWLEVPDDLRDASAIAPLVGSLGFDPAHPLSTKISAGDWERLSSVARADGITNTRALERLRPWAAAVMFSALAQTRGGYSPNAGVEQSIRSEMDGKPIYGLETVSDQLHLFSNMSRVQEVAFLHETLLALSHGNARMVGATDWLETAWQRGDVAKLALLDRAISAEDRGFGEALLPKRNANWAKKLDDRLHGEGTSFVAVGAAHLAGHGSLIEDLSKLGYTVTRIE